MTIRHELKERNGRRGKFTAKLERFGGIAANKWHPQIKTLLLVDVRDEQGKLVTEHLWFHSGLWSAALKPGDRFSFEARVKTYTKGYRGRREDPELPPQTTDYKLAFPSKVRKLDEKLEALTNSLFEGRDESYFFGDPTV